MISLLHWRKALLLLLCTACTSAMAFSTRTERWSEDALLSDGRVVKVEREVSYTFQFISGDAASMQLFASWPDKFWIRFKHPETHKTITWQGEQYYSPVLLDFVNGVPYLVVYGGGSKKTKAIYGCPELPYTYLKYQPGFMGKWTPVSVERAPAVLRKANLSPSYPAYRQNMSPNDIQRNMSDAEHNSSGFFQRVIPRTYEEWNYLFKNDHLNERQQGDCRPPRRPPPQVILPVAMESSPVVLNAINYPQDRVVVGDDWSIMMFDRTRESACKKLFRPADQNDYMKGQRFVKDSTNSKPVPYSRTAQFSMGVRVLCDDYVWFVTHQETPGKIVISKFTLTGDLIYRTSFRNPDQVEGFIGYIRVPSLRSRDGYLYFDWLDFRDISRKWHIKRWLEMRIREPEMPNPAVKRDAPQAARPLP